jgi:hypothetical protein
MEGTRFDTLTRTLLVPCTVVEQSLPPSRVGSPSSSAWLERKGRAPTIRFLPAAESRISRTAASAWSAPGVTIATAIRVGRGRTPLPVRAVAAAPRSTIVASRCCVRGGRPGSSAKSMVRAAGSVSQERSPAHSAVTVRLAPSRTQRCCPVFRAPSLSASRCLGCAPARLSAHSGSISPLRAVVRVRPLRAAARLSARSRAYLQANSKRSRSWQLN